MTNFWRGTSVKLRALEPTDAEHFFRWQRDSERTRFLDMLPPPTSLAAYTSWAEERSQRGMKDDTFQWMVETLKGDVVGSIATHTCNPRAGTFSYGLDIAREHRRFGYASEAVLLVLRYYFEEMRYQKATVAVQSDNPASIGLHRKLEFCEEGVHRRMAYQHGQYIDLVWFGMTHEEFRERAARKQLSRA